MQTKNVKFNSVTIEDYKARLGHALSSNGISCDEIANNTEYKNFIYQYADEELIKKEMRHKLMGETYRMAVTDLEKYSSNSEKTKLLFPIINKYHGHSLVETFYFAKDNDGIKVCSVPVVKPIINIRG